MTKSRKPAAYKPYGNGFDILTAKADYADFLAWWNDRSHYPVGQAAPAADMRLAA